MTTSSQIQQRFEERVAPYRAEYLKAIENSTLVPVQLINGKVEYVFSEDHTAATKLFHDHCEQEFRKIIEGEKVCADT